MKAVIQRVARASVTICEQETRSMDRGMVILLGVRDGDALDDAKKLARKCAGLRIFPDESGRMNLSAEQLALEALVVSNFTLYADTAKGRRPAFTQAAKPAQAKECYECFLQELKKTQLRCVQAGEFGADMKLELVNDGPVTIVMQTEEWAQHGKE